MRRRGICRAIESIELSRDAEVQQLHAAVGGDENVRRLEIAMHHHVPVRVLDGFTDAPERAKAIAQSRCRVRGSVGSAARLRRIPSPARAFHRAGYRRRTAVAIDRMVQLREDPLLAREAFATRR